MGRLSLAVVAAGALASFACSHPTGSGKLPTGTAGTTGAAGTSGPGSAGVSGGAGTTGSGGTTGTAGDGGPGMAGTTGSAGDGGPGSAGTTGAAGDGAGGTGSGSGGTTGAGGSGSSGPNLIANGDFSSGAANWHTEMGTGSVNGSGAYCISNPGAALMGWDAPAGSPVTLSSGTGYRFSYQASGSGTVSIKIGMATPPYDTIYMGMNGVSSSPQTFTHSFTANSSPAIGLAFTFTNAGSSTVCIDNVTLAAD